LQFVHIAREIRPVKAKLQSPPFKHSIPIHSSTRNYHGDDVGETLLDVDNASSRSESPTSADTPSAHCHNQTRLTDTNTNDMPMIATAMLLTILIAATCASINQSIIKRLTLIDVVKVARESSTRRRVQSHTQQPNTSELQRRKEITLMTSAQTTAPSAAQSHSARQPTT
jgi:hypothetical protein